MARNSNEITFVVSGQEHTASLRQDAPQGARVRSAVRVGARRGGAAPVRLKATVGEDVVRLHIANGPTLYLHPEHASELLRAQLGSPTARGGSAAGGEEGDVVVPSQLGWRGLATGADAGGTRGRITDWIGDVVVDGVDILTGLVKGKAAKLAGEAVTKKLDGQVDEGVYRLAPQSLTPLKGSATKQDRVPAAPDARAPLLVFVHGTASSASGSFGKLWQTHPASVQQLFDHYGGRVYALDHETLGVSPFANALTLVNALPNGARLHLVTHSRGGLVAEALARVCAGLGTSDEELELFEGAGYEQHRRDLEKLAAEVRGRKITVERIVRVACPARGTLLASRRLDAYLSVFKWGLEGAGIPVAPQLVDFIAEVARRRARPDELPGLEAMMPDRPFTRWLNAPAEPIAGDLRVVAGDMQGDSVLTWLKTLLSDSFYWTDNDLVVQTRSMYGGTPRADGHASFVLDRGAKVSHFSYFSNERTANLITHALIDDQPDTFSAIGPLSWAGEDASGTRAARVAARSRGAKRADRPAVFVLPGILGSHLSVDGKRIWLSVRFVNHLERLRWSAKTAARVTPDGPVGMSYDDLIDRLADTHEVVPFGFDWRRPIEDEAGRLADEIDEALEARAKTKQAVRIVAHSMGGLVARTMELERPKTWKRFVASPGARLLMLGTPNGGSFAPMQVMSGDDSFGNLFNMFGSLFDGHAARQIVAEMPGLVQLQAGLVGGKLDLGKESTWRDLQTADLESVRKRIKEGAFWHNDPLQVRAMEWGIPPQAVLDKAVALRKRLDGQVARLGTDLASMALVVGNAKSTPAEVGIFDGDVLYSDTTIGDGRVTLTNALLPGVKTWQVDAVHGDLADVRKAFDAYVDLLNTGATARLTAVTGAATSRGAGGAAETTLTRSRPARAVRSDAPPSMMSDVFSSQPDRQRPEGGTGARLLVRVTNGNLKFVRSPLLLGHYHSLRLTGTEKVIDGLVGDMLSQSLTARLYPSDVGTHEVFVNLRRNLENPYALPRPEAAIVIGLGEEGSLNTTGLIDSVRQGVIAYAQRLAERGSGAPATFELASTLIGSGGISISAGVSAQAAAIGVRQANTLLARTGWPVVTRLQLVELFLDRASEALNALRSMGESEAQDIVVEPFVESGQGGLPRPSEFGYRGAEYDLISVYERKTEKTTELEFTLSTRRARDEVRGTMAQSKLVDDLVAAGANDANDDPRIGRTLFQLLVPIELESFVGGSKALQLQLDSKTATYPWEMLDLKHGDLDGRGDATPWGIQTRLLRKLRTPQFRAAPHSAVDGGVLVIGEPQCPPDQYPPLPGASAEATAVAEVLGAKPLLKADAMTVSNAMFDRSYSILHVAGHGDIVDGIGGVVLSNGITFGPREIAQLRIVPDLAFINCCYLGQFTDDSTKPRHAPPGGMPAFAANVAEELIKNGVRCVIAAGWAVDDDAAMLFARTFYLELTRGKPFVDAVGEARARTYARFPRSNTWAAYQCYGDRDWTYRGATAQRSSQSAPPTVGSARALILHLKTLQTRHQFDDLAAEEVREELRYLVGACRDEWRKLGGVAAAFGAAYGEIDAFEEAIQWYSRAIAAEDGGAGMRALEQLGNMRARHGERTQDVQEVRAAIELLERLVKIASTVERESLLASAYKRLAGALGSNHESRAALGDALEHYRAAERIARDNKVDNLFYPALNCMSLELRLGVDGDTAVKLDAQRVNDVRQSLDSKNRDNPDFWSVVGETELAVYEALAARDLARVVGATIVDLSDVARRVTSKGRWDSVTFQMRVTLSAYLETRGLSTAERAAAGKLLAQFSPATKPRSKPRRKRRPAKPGRKRRKRSR